VSAAEEIARISSRLREIAERLRAPDLAEEDADGLAREAADLVARAGNELDRAVAEGAGGDNERE
jgi:hypothetical protein